jgi:Pyridoxamine 5'-phosphate oxidase
VSPMATWQEFCEEAPELAEPAGARFEASGLVLVATLRRDGWPRISPVEPILMEGRIYLGMMPNSMKSVDLRRDPRVLVHSVVTDKDGKDGEAKLYGTATEITDADERERYCQALFAKIGWRPELDALDLWTVDIGHAAWQIFGEGGRQHASTWTPGSAPTVVK